MNYQPDPDAAAFAREMARKDGIKLEIIEETVKSHESGQILESGRTVCGDFDSVYGPIGRFPKSVQLRRCGGNQLSGAYHSHVTPDELRSPKNSLADMALVAFGGMDVINVTGTETEEFFIAPRDDTAFADDFAEVVGADSVRDIVSAIASGEMEPEEGQRRVREAFPALIMERPTGLGEAAPMIPATTVPRYLSKKPYDAIEAHAFYIPQMPSPGGSLGMECSHFRARVDEAGEKMERVAPDGIGNKLQDEVIATTVGLVVGRVVEGILFE